MIAGGLTLDDPEDVAAGKVRVRPVHGAEIFRP